MESLSSSGLVARPHWAYEASRRASYLSSLIAAFIVVDLAIGEKLGSGLEHLIVAERQAFHERIMCEHAVDDLVPRLPSLTFVIRRYLLEHACDITHFEQIPIF